MFDDLSDHGNGSWLWCCLIELEPDCSGNTNYCKTLFFRRILISWFPYVENSLHFKLADFPVNFIKPFVSFFFSCLKQMLLSKFNSYYCLHYIIPRILHIISWECWYSMQINLWWWAIPKICVYLLRDFAQITIFLQCFDTVGWVIRPIKTRPRYDL